MGSRFSRTVMQIDLGARSGAVRPRAEYWVRSQETAGLGIPFPGEVMASQQSRTVCFQEDLPSEILRCLQSPVLMRRKTIRNPMYCTEQKSDLFQLNAKQNNGRGHHFVWVFQVLNERVTEKLNKWSFKKSTHCMYCVSFAKYNYKGSLQLVNGFGKFFLSYVKNFKVGTAGHLRMYNVFQDSEILLEQRHLF